ncbi:hypothetical protein BD626DRAFT_390788 [Schizophyllum amplum]|uniref:SET domain-containing protein n=1 Tax=Schizophyllum amplum TaxID=97359 RepID=A0A550CZU2_9AGAR|nr:hypothetical protein BD626DRAFT_390788 [Auriculariopsis ampla]
MAGHVRSRRYVLHDFAIGTRHRGVAFVDSGVRDILRAHPPAPAPYYPTDTFVIRRAGDKGLGMFTTSALRVGAIALIEHPTVIAPFVLGLTDTPACDFYDDLFGSLPMRQYEMLMGLANCMPRTSVGHAEGVMATNALAIELDVPATGSNQELSTHRAIFMQASRINHSCSPNAKWEWDRKTLSLTLRAVRPIRAGEEITINYVDPAVPRAERRASLRTTYHFDCNCAACARGDPRSDIARTELRAFGSGLPAFDVWCRDARMPDMVLIRAHERALALIETEGLEVLGCREHIDVITMCYGALADENMFRYWANESREERAQDNMGDLKVVQTWISNPRALPVWGWRRDTIQARRRSSRSPK